MMKFMGYVRPSGRVGVRNHVLILPTVVCANDVAMRIAAQLPGAVYVTHEHGCGQLPPDLAQTRRTLLGYGSNPNVAACLVVGLGCEALEPHPLAEDIDKAGTPSVAVVIQEEGGSVGCIAKGVALAQAMMARASRQTRVECDISELTLGLECGGSDAWSGLSANPVTGQVSDLLIAEGGRSILSETQELIGAEHLLAQRAASPEIGNALLRQVRRAEEGSLRMGVDIRFANPSQGNMAGGITTLEEKSLGCIHKAGRAPLNEVVEYAETPTKKGLIFMDTPGHDAESTTGLLAGGAQVVIFTTGLGTCLGAAIAPVIKVASNTALFEKMGVNLDFNAGVVIDGRQSISEAGRELFEEMIKVCNGQATKSEVLGYGGFAINRIGPTQ